MVLDGECLLFGLEFGLPSVCLGSRGVCVMSERHGRQTLVIRCDDAWCEMTAFLELLDIDIDIRWRVDSTA